MSVIHGCMMLVGPKKVHLRKLLVSVNMLRWMSEKWNLFLKWELYARYKDIWVILQRTAANISWQLNCLSWTFQHSCTRYIDYIQRFQKIWNFSTFVLIWLTRRKCNTVIEVQKIPTTSSLYLGRSTTMSGTKAWHDWNTVERLLCILQLSVISHKSEISGYLSLLLQLF